MLSSFVCPETAIFPRAYVLEQSTWQQRSMAIADEISTLVSLGSINLAATQSWPGTLTDAFTGDQVNTFSTAEDQVLPLIHLMSLDDYALEQLFIIDGTGYSMTIKPESLAVTVLSTDNTSELADQLD